MANIISVEKVFAILVYLHLNEPMRVYRTEKFAHICICVQKCKNLNERKVKYEKKLGANKDGRMQIAGV